MHFLLWREANLPREQITDLIAHAVGPPVEEQVRRVLERDYSAAGTALHVMADDSAAVGVIGVRRIGPRRAEILHIAVEPAQRRHGVGRMMIALLVADAGLCELVAETDRDAVGFYRRCGFAVQSLGEKYPGVERFLCTWTQAQ